MQIWSMTYDGRWIPSGCDQLRGAGHLRVEVEHFLLETRRLGRVPLQLGPPFLLNELHHLLFETHQVILEVDVHAGVLPQSALIYAELNRCMGEASMRSRCFSRCTIVPSCGFDSNVT